jgi:hypothetical protein
MRNVSRDADVAAYSFAVTLTILRHGMPEQAAGGAGAGSLNRCDRVLLQDLFLHDALAYVQPFVFR